MLRGGTSSEWARCMCLVLLLELVHFSVGAASGIQPRKDCRDQIVPLDKLSIAEPSRLPCTTNCPPVITVLNSKEEDHLPPDVLNAQCVTWATRQKSLNLFRKLISVIGSRQAQFCIEAVMNSSPAEEFSKEMSDDVEHGAKHSVDFISIRSNRRLLLRGRPGHRFWSLKQQQPADQQRRRVLQETSSPPASQQTQQFLLGPPAPSALVHNEKQDWNQDYAEPDVHPPSSN